MEGPEKVERDVLLDKHGHAIGHPRGTLAVMLLFLMLMIGLWTYIYTLMIERI